MTATALSSRAGMVFAAAALSLLLAACQEREVILVGEREDIRPNVEGTALQPAPDPIDNVSRAISLPAQQTNATWAQTIGTTRPSNPALRTPPQLVWSANIGEGNARRVRITAEPVVAGGLIYTLDSGATASGVSPSGQVVWQTNLVPAGDSNQQATGGGMAYDNGTLYVSSGFGLLSALDARTGGIRWQQKLGATGSGAPLIRDGIVYLVAGDDTGWAVNAKDGKIAWKIDSAPSIAHVLGAPAPVIAGQYVVFAFGSGEIVGAFRRGGLVRWNQTVAGRHVGKVVSRYGDITGSPVVVGNTIYIGNHSGITSALNAVDGKTLWSQRVGALSPVWPVGGSIFAVTEQLQLVRLNASDGAIVWAVDLPGFKKLKPRRHAQVYANYGPILAGSRLVVASSDGYLRFFSAESGSQIGAVQVPGGATTSPVVANGTLYVVSADGKLLAFR